MARSGTVISGSIALQFLDRVFYPDSDLDLYVYGQSCREVMKWIVEDSGKNFRYTPGVLEPEPRNLETALDEVELKDRCQREGMLDESLTWPSYESIRDYSYHSDWTTGVFTLTSDNADDPNHPLKIQIVVATSSPMESILSFHSTVVMNAITAYAAYSFYPRATFEERRTIVLDDESEQKQAALNKYAARGYAIEMSVPRKEQRSPQSAFRSGERWVDDKWSWIMPFSMEGVTLPQTPQQPSQPLTSDPFALNAWYFTSTNIDGPSVAWYLMHYRTLKFQYTTVKGFRDFLLTSPITTLQPGRTRIQHQGKLGNFWNDATAGGSETWRDTEVPDWLEEYRKHPPHDYGGYIELELDSMDQAFGDMLPFN